MAAQIPSRITPADRDEINASAGRWAELCLKRDFNTLLNEMCTEDVILLPSDHPVCNGRKESLAYLNEYPEVAAFTSRVTDVQGGGEMAVAQGRFDQTVKADGNSVRAIGEWLGTYRKTSSGWKMAQVIWNNDAPIS